MYIHEDSRFCPEGWETHKTFCYQLSDKKRSFNDAKTECEQKNAHLFTVQTEEDVNFWHKEVDLKKIDSAWIGLTWNENMRRWNWMNGKPTTIDSAPSSNRCPMFAKSGPVLNAVLTAAAMINPSWSKLSMITKMAITGGEPCETKHHYYCQSYGKFPFNI